MLVIYWWQKIAKALIASLTTGVLVLSLISCSNRAVTQTVPPSASPSQSSGNISEVSPPEVIQALRQALEIYQPQVAIASPKPEEVLQDNTVTVRLQVENLPIFKNPKLDLGPHLHVILDNEPYIAVYDLNQPLVLPDLSPGTHTLRVFASRPWHESFKNEGAYAQTTFHIFTKTSDNNPVPDKPLLTYSRPKGNYGAEPILLDFYLTNAPLHLAAQENPNDDIADWRIRCTVNGESFVLDRWAPVYLKGFKPGKNWVQLEFIDEQGNLVKNVFNNTVRLITYEPKGKDTLSQLVRGELSVADARGIVDLNYTAKTPTPTPSPVVTPSATPNLEQTPAPQDEDKPAAPEVEPKKLEQAELETANKSENQKPRGFFNRFRRPDATSAPSLPPTLPEIIESPSPEAIVPQPDTPEPQLVTPREETSPKVETAPLSEPEPKAAKSSDKPKSGGFFNRFRRPTATPSPDLPPTLPEIIEAPTPAPVAPEVTSEPDPSVSPTPSVEEKPNVEQPKDPNPETAAPEPKLDIKEILLP